MTVHFPTFQHLFHHLLLILPLMNEKAQLLLDFFDKLRNGKYRSCQPVEKPPGVRGPQPPEALIGFGDMRVKSAKSLA